MCFNKFQEILLPKEIEWYSLSSKHIYVTVYDFYNFLRNPFAQGDYIVFLEIKPTYVHMTFIDFSKIPSTILDNTINTKTRKHIYNF